MLLALLVPTAATAAPPTATCERQVNDTYAELLGCVTTQGVLEHMQAFQRIADANDDPYYPGTRAAGTEGYQASVDYVAGLLKQAGYRVTLDPMVATFQFPATLEQLTPLLGEYETGAFTGSGWGAVSGPVVPVDINLAGDRASTSGCEASDFADLDFSGTTDIALVQRGTCFFGTKARNAQNAGAEAVVIFNQGDTPDREALIVADGSSLDDPANPGTALPDPITHDIPVVGASFQQGVALSQSGSTAFVEVIEPEQRTNYNVIAELPGTNRNNVVMAGAHLDSVTEGPGIQDNGSGSAALLETALMMANTKHPNTLRFAWWAAEEEGLLGSADYVAGLPQRELDRIALYMNYDMIASPNYVQTVYDANQSTFPAPVAIPEGSAAIEDLYERWYTSVGEPYDDSEFSGRSDYEAFILAGIPSSGLFTGAEEVKTKEQARIWGGTAGDWFDPCYHQACDDLSNLALDALDVNSDLIAYAMLTFGYSTQSVNGVAGQPVPGGAAPLPAPAGPEGTFQERGGGGGLDHDHDGEPA
jgi:hypothetical protein